MLMMVVIRLGQKASKPLLKKKHSSSETAEDGNPALYLMPRLRHKGTNFNDVKPLRLILSRINPVLSKHSSLIVIIVINKTEHKHTRYMKQTTH